MERMIGSGVDIHLKFNEVLSGVLFDSDEQHVYLQSGLGNVVCVPRENIKYYVSGGNGKAQKDVTHPTSPPANPSSIGVYVDDVKITDIMVAPDVDITTCNEAVLKAIWGNEEVQNATRGAVQRSLEYDVGEARIVTSQAQILKYGAAESEHASYSMGGNAQASTPYEMAKNLSEGRKLS